MDHDNASRARRDGLLERMHVNVPAVIVKQRIADELYVIHVGQKIKERITGRGDQEFVAGIAEQAKNERVSFTGAGGEEQIVDGNMLAAFGVIVAHSLARRFQVHAGRDDIAATPDCRELAGWPARHS